MLKFLHIVYHKAILPTVKKTPEFIYTTVRVREPKLFTPSQYNNVWAGSTRIERGKDYV